MEFDLVKFINEGYTAQDAYAAVNQQLGPSDFLRDSSPEINKLRYEKIIEHMSHMIEEIVEARVYVPRRSWKKSEHSYLDSPKLREEFIVELYDVLLFFRATLAFAGVTGEEFAALAEKKNKYNSSRPDHNVNSGEYVVPAPNAELQGLCDSAKMNV